jgi:CubicO group peptidase (beta-lactamase class C family)
MLSLFSKHVFAIFAASLITQSAYPQNDLAQQIRESLAQQHVPGAAIAVVKEGKVVEEIVYGSASLQLNVPVQRQTVFQLASTTKVFTAVALFRLEQQGKLNLNDPVSKYLSGLPPAWGEVSLRELASHTSGLPDIISDPSKALTPEELRRSSDEALSVATKQPVSAPPGTRFQYDQTNYLLLKRVIEHVSGHNFRDFVKRNVLIDMPSTVWGDARTIIPERCEMYTALRGDHIENGTDLFVYPDYLDSAAGLNSTIADMENFAIRITSGRLLSSAEFDKMWQPAINRSGELMNTAPEMKIEGVFAPANGWFYADNSSGKYPRVFMAGGSATSIVVFPKQQLCIVVLTNLQAQDDPVPIAEEIAKHYIPDLKPML